LGPLPAATGILSRPKRRHMTVKPAP
jgi:hypothetical protein